MSKGSIRNNEDGIISIVVTMIVMMVVTLIVLGFAQLMRRESQQALDRQLSIQAFYAAESGVNEVDHSVDLTTFNNTTCATGPSTSNQPLVPGSNVAFTCVLVNGSPFTVEHEVGVNESKIVPLAAANGNQLQSLKIAWGKASGANNFWTNRYGHPNSGFPTVTAWGDKTGMVRVDLIPYRDGNTITRADIINQTQSLYLYPSDDGGSVITMPYNGVDQSVKGQVVGRCDPTISAYPCSVTITGLPGTDANKYKYIARVRALYGTVKVSISGEDVGGPTGLTGQISIDATGRAGDVIRRIQVRRGVGNFNSYVDLGIQSADDVCKRLIVYANNDTQPDSGTNTSDDPQACRTPFAP